MESDVTQSALFYKLWAWGDKNRKQILYGLIGLAVVGIIAAFWLAHANEKQKEANAALAQLTNRTVTGSGQPPTADAYLKVAADYPDSDAAQRALLLAAGNLFTEGKYDVAMAHFQKFIKDYNSSPFAGQAALGIASCYDAMGKTNDAISGYQGVLQRYGDQNVEPQARLRIGKLLEAQGKYREARDAYENLARKYQGTMMGSEGFTLYQELNTAHPDAPVVNPAAATSVPTISMPTAPAATAPSTSAVPVVTNK
jgi:predicted negative regulator of RcsB-dependent stress response